MQAGGELPYFAGRDFQRGHGLLSSLGRFALPILKSFAPQIIDKGCNYAKDKVQNMTGAGYKRSYRTRKRSVRRKNFKKTKVKKDIFS